MTDNSNKLALSPAADPSKTQPGPPQSLTYTLPSNVGPTDIGGLIGKGAQGLKKTITGAWRMYEMNQKSENKVDEPKPSLRIVLKESDESVEAEIISSSMAMRKLAKRSLDNHVEEFCSVRTLQSYTFVAECHHHLLGQLIGKKASGLTRLLESVYNTGGESQFIKPGDIETAKTARLRIKELDFDNAKAVREFVKGRRNTSFVGWPPEDDDDDEFISHISLTVTFKHGSKPFEEIDSYRGNLQSLIADRIQEIMSNHSDEMEEIEKCLGNSSD
jgi:hypothetical protein